jgi:mono/diheme cytochrome c family protein
VGKLFKASIVLLTSTALVLSGLYVYARHRIFSPPDISPPPIARATSPAAIVRGEVLFRTACAGCHADPITHRFTGTVLDFPSFFGHFESANLTSDRDAGIGALSDAVIARALRVGISRDGRLLAMPRLPELSDDDVAAILGFLRSGDPDLAPSPIRHPKPRYAPLGTIILAFLFPAYPAAARSGIPMPEKAATPAYGRYLANNVLDCFECHTDGFGRDKLQKPGLYGGRSFPGGDGQGHPVYAPNLTPHETGLRRWTLEDFSLAVRAGVTPDGRLLGPPMIRLELLDNVDIEAIWLYLRSLPPVERASPVIQPGRALPKQETVPPAQLFVSLGCAGCHARGQPFADKLSGAAGKSVEEVAHWIRMARQVRPDTTMPNYESLLDEANALRLAAWVQEQATRGPIDSPGAKGETTVSSE